MMTLEEAINHCEEVALRKDIEAEEHNPRYTGLIMECKECAAEHRQLAEWLKTLKKVQEIITQHDIDCMPGDYKVMTEEPEIIRCKDCANWDRTWTNDYAPDYHYCPMIDGARKKDFFCADAEKIEETEEKK